MDDTNYQQLLDENKKLADKLTELESRIEDVCKFNKTLLDTKVPQQDKTKDTQAIEKKLKEALKNV